MVMVIILYHIGLNINCLLPQFFSIARIGVLPRDYSMTWYIVQTIIGILLFVLIIIRDKRKISWKIRSILVDLKDKIKRY